MIEGLNKKRTAEPLTATLSVEPEPKPTGDPGPWGPA